MRPLWQRYFEGTLFSQLDFILMLAEKKVLPSFGNIDFEAEAVAESKYTELMSKTYDPNIDPGSEAEKALDEGTAHLESMVNLRQSFFNLLTVWLYHLFEQHLLIFHKSCMLNQNEEKDISKINRLEFIKRVKNKGIDIEKFDSYQQIEVLRLLANVVKHAEGNSCQLLHNKRPDFFERKDPLFSNTMSLQPLPVDLPLGGADIYVSLDDIREFIDSIKKFWNEFWVKEEEINMVSGQTRLL